jgi:TldD protein
MKMIQIPITSAPELLSAAALETASGSGATVAQFRLAKHDSRGVSLRDGAVENIGSESNVALSVRVLHSGAWGFAATTEISIEAAVDAAKRAVLIAILSSKVLSDDVVLADEPVHGRQSWKLPIEIDAFEKTESEIIDFLQGWNSKVSASAIVSHIESNIAMGRDQTFYSDLVGNEISQQRDRISAALTAIHVSDSGFEDMRTCAPPAGRGWEYLTGTGWDWDSEISRIPDYLDEKTKSPSVTPGAWDLVIDPTNLWLTIHESIGHATELDRALGYEANYAGTSFATIDKLGSFKYGSPIMNVTGDRTADHGLSTVGFDDEGVAAQKWDLIKDGVLVGYQTDRSIASKINMERSNGCAFADSALHSPIQRMPNVSLQPGVEDLSTNDLISNVESGIYIVGDKSWSIDMQRFNFQFTGQRFHEIKNGKIVGQLKDVAYQSRTPDFWASMRQIGGPSTYLLGGALNCGKGQPGQVAPVSHGCPSATFTQVNVLNTRDESSK